MKDSLAAYKAMRDHRHEWEDMLPTVEQCTGCGQLRILLEDEDEDA